MGHWHWWVVSFWHDQTERKPLPKAYPSFDLINILEAKSLRFVQSIGVSDAIPRTESQEYKVESIASNQDLNLVSKLELLPETTLTSLNILAFCVRG